jgi:hypothetical protein
MPLFDSAIPFADLADRNRTDWGYYTVPQKNSAQAMTNAVCTLVTQFDKHFGLQSVRLAVGKALGGDSVLGASLDCVLTLDCFTSSQTRAFTRHQIWPTSIGGRTCSICLAGATRT